MPEVRLIVLGMTGFVAKLENQSSERLSKFAKIFISCFGNVIKHLMLTKKLRKFFTCFLKKKNTIIKIFENIFLIKTFCLFFEV